MLSLSSVCTSIIFAFLIESKSLTTILIESLTCTRESTLTVFSGGITGVLFLPPKKYTKPKQIIPTIRTVSCLWKTLIPSLSSNLIFSIGNNEISNPSSYYKKYDEEYYRYRLEQKKYLDYNYNYMMNNEYLKHKK